MTRRPAKDLNLIQGRMAALYDCDGRGRSVRVNQWDGGTPPIIHLAKTADGNAWCIRDDVPDEIALDLDRLCRHEPPLRIGERVLTTREAVLSTVARFTISSSIGGGPVYLLPGSLDRPVGTALLDARDQPRLHIDLAEWRADLHHRHPFVGAIEAAQVVAVCASVRIRAAVHEAGVETATPYRRRGHAHRAVAAWAAAVRASGALPCYSTSWHNTASQKTAASLRARSVGFDFSISG